MSTTDLVNSSDTASQDDSIEPTTMSDSSALRSWWRRDNNLDTRFWMYPQEGQTMSADTDRVLELLRRAVSILETESEKPQIRPVSAHEDETTLEGTLGKFEVLNVGTDQVPLFKGTIKVRTPEGQEKWLRFQAWRKVALFAAHNFETGQVIQAIGRWEQNSYTNRDGEVVETNVFSARLVTAA